MVLTSALLQEIELNKNRLVNEVVTRMHNKRNERAETRARQDQIKEKND